MTVMRVPEMAVATTFDGALGGVVSAIKVVAVATFEYPPRLPAASLARTR